MKQFHFVRLPFKKNMSKYKMSSFLDEIKNKLKEGRTELKIISGGGKEPGSNNSSNLWIVGIVVLIVLIIIVVIVLVLSNKSDDNPNLIQMDKKEDPEEIIKDLTDASSRIKRQEKNIEQEYQDPNFTLLKDLVHG